MTTQPLVEVAGIGLYHVLSPTGERIGMLHGRMSPSGRVTMWDPEVYHPPRRLKPRRYRTDAAKAVIHDWKRAS